MNNLLTALATKVSGSTLSNDVGGRIFIAKVPDDEANNYPRVVISIISVVMEKTFTEIYWNVLMQVDLISTVSAGLAQITTMDSDLTALLDDCLMSITGFTLVSCERKNLSPMVDDIVMPDGTNGAHFWPVEFEIKLSKN